MSRAGYNWGPLRPRVHRRGLDRHARPLARAQTIWACQAGKDVYGEKPCSHNIFEGRQMVAAARKYKRIVQHGTNSRSSAAVREAVGKLRQGVIGDVYLARGLCFRRRDTIGRTPDEPVPPGVHYDLWLGPAARRPFSRNRFHYNWHWNWEYGNGELALPFTRKFLLDKFIGIAHTGA